MVILSQKNKLFIIEKREKILVNYLRFNSLVNIGSESGRSRIGNCSKNLGNAIPSESLSLFPSIIFMIGLLYDLLLI